MKTGILEALSQLRASLPGSTRIPGNDDKCIPTLRHILEDILENEVMARAQHQICEDVLLFSLYVRLTTLSCSG